MIARITGAALRGILVALVVVIPALYLPSAATTSTEIVVLLAILGFVLTFAEYNSTFPSFIEFRDAPPLNRMRFIALMTMITMLTLISKDRIDPTNITALFSGFGLLVAHLIDFPYSPVRLVVLMLPQGAGVDLVYSVRVAAAVAYVIALLTVFAFWVAVRIRGWPTGNGAFNVWINLPLFDPTTGGDVVARLQRDGRINMILGVLLPFLIPAIVKMASDIFDPINLYSPQTLIWTMSAWAFLPASMIMRGLAMIRIAELIEEKRRRVYSNAEAMQTA
ncbi:hypothetical protein KBY24_19155 [Ruegeria pomeroyi]|uniref:Uncharacterized protein n=1 Tax=Ruegeria alba TaxID=2916756 RepID=A0ABS9P144_9RHOB|nr:hypothetical protein [Ruegeria pomeroyi]MCG6560208.1 hypothetical protein [Ruegeria alba]MCE8523223.1 hypothetical protein [Ruegeria pomeroyi]MCE8527329.1 hypothetical protein [Ruegeria pomeroyi]MCE8531367.1 hypothetical protein [Ruegeria pomeroyi]